MTARDDAIAAVDAYAQSAADSVVAEQVVPLQAQVTDLSNQLAATKRQVADLVNQLIACQSAQQGTVLYGANIGGWKSDGETQTAAHTRIKAGFGGKLPAIRVWPSSVPTVGSQYLDDTCKSYVIEVNSGLSDAQLAAAFDPKVSPAGTVFTVWHEPEAKTTPATFQAYLARVGKARVNSGRTDVDVAACLQGGSYAGRSGYTWTDWVPSTLPPGVTMIGGDLYPRDAELTNPLDGLLKPCLAAAQKMNVPFLVGEFGCGKPTWTDQQRADWTSAAFGFFDGNGKWFPYVLVYESSVGSGGPWCVLPHPDGSGGYPLTVEVVRERMSR